MFLAELQSNLLTLLFVYICAKYFIVDLGTGYSIRLISLTSFHSLLVLQVVVLLLDRNFCMIIGEESSAAC